MSIADWQVDDEARSRPGVAFCDDRAAMRTDDLPRDRQAQAGVRPEFFAARALAVKAVEDRLQLVVGDAGPLFRGCGCARDI